MSGPKHSILLDKCPEMELMDRSPGICWALMGATKPAQSRGSLVYSHCSVGSSSSLLSPASAQCCHLVSVSWCSLEVSICISLITHAGQHPSHSLAILWSKGVNFSFSPSMSLCVSPSLSVCMSDSVCLSVYVCGHTCAHVVCVYVNVCLCACTGAHGYVEAGADVSTFIYGFPLCLLFEKSCYVYGHFCLHVCLCTVCMPDAHRPEESTASLETGDFGSFELPCG